MPWLGGQINRTMRTDETIEGARKALLNRMIATLEHHHWHTLTRPEFVLWKQLFEDKPEIAPETLRALKEESEAAGGWWTWPRSRGIQDEGLFMGFAEWDAERAKADVP